MPLNARFRFWYSSHSLYPQNLVPDYGEKPWGRFYLVPKETLGTKLLLWNKTSRVNYQHFSWNKVYKL